MMCPKCLSNVPLEAQACFACGQALEEQRQANRETVHCPQCGAENRDIALYCESCGQLLADAPEVPDAWAISRIPEREEDFPPRELGDLMGETLDIYRQAPWTFIFIILIAQLPALFASIISSAIVFAALLPLTIVLSAWGQGAMTYGVVQHYLARPFDVVSCYARAWDRLVSLVLPSTALAVAAFGVPVLVVLMGVPGLIVLWVPFMLIILVRWFFFTQAVMVEGHRTFRSLGRSQDLVRGYGWRVFGIGAVFVLVSAAVSLLLSMPGLLIGEAVSVLGDIVVATAAVVSAPFLGIGATVVYFDLRARKGGYDLARLGEEMEP